MKNVWTLVGIVLLVVLLALLVGGAAVTLGRAGAVGMMGRYGGFGMMGGFHPLGGLIAIMVGLFIIGGIALFVMTIAGSSSSAPASTATPTRESPLDILKMRYAKGELTKEQYDALKQDLA